MKQIAGLPSCSKPAQIPSGYASVASTKCKLREYVLRTASRWRNFSRFVKHDSCSSPHLNEIDVNVWNKQLAWDAKLGIKRK